MAPDAGALKKCYAFAEAVGAREVVSCSKHRDLKTGKILGLTCEASVGGKDLFVLDDICDGGRTFIEVSRLLRPRANSIDLAVTHGIFSKGTNVVAECFDRVYTTNSYHREALSDEQSSASNVFWVGV